MSTSYVRALFDDRQNPFTASADVWPEDISHMIHIETLYVHMSSYYFLPEMLQVSSSDLTTAGNHNDTNGGRTVIEDQIVFPKLETLLISIPFLISVDFIHSPFRASSLALTRARLRNWFLRLKDALNSRLHSQEVVSLKRVVLIGSVAKDSAGGINGVCSALRDVSGEVVECVEVKEWGRRGTPSTEHLWELLNNSECLYGR